MSVADELSPPAPSLLDAILANAPASRDDAAVQAAALWDLGYWNEAAALVHQFSLTGPHARPAAGSNLPGWIGVPAVADAAPVAVARSSAPFLSEIARLTEQTGDALDALLLHERAAALAPGEPVIKGRRDAALARVQTELSLASVLDPPVDPEPYRPIPGSWLLIVPESLPQSLSDSAFDAHEQAKAWILAGFPGSVVTLLPFPWDLDPAQIPLREEIDCVPYYRLLPDGPFPERPMDLLYLNLEAASPLLTRLRPATLQASPELLSRLVVVALSARFGLPALLTEAMTDRDRG